MAGALDRPTNSTVDGDPDLLCALEPIHIPGSIQAHGACLVVAPVLDGFNVVGASRNAAMLLASSSPKKLVGASLASVLGINFAEAVQQRFQSGRLRGDAPWQSSLGLGSLNVDVAVHDNGGIVLVELEPAGTQDEADAQAAIHQLQNAIIDLRDCGNDLDALARASARGVRLLTGYDRVLVYRFDSDWNGQTIAEDKEADWDQSFAGMLCPASDIPAQARELYRRSPMRSVADRDAPPVPIDMDEAWMEDHPSPRGIDLSFARLRSQSPVHMQIHRNLGINGSMSLSILYEGRLWGLMICHHRRRHRPSPSQLSAAAVLTNAFALRVGPVERTESEQFRRRDRVHLSALLVHMAEASFVIEALTTCDVTIGNLFASTGAAVLYAGNVSVVGHTPPEGDVRELASWLSTQSGGSNLFQTNNLGAAFPPWKQHEAVASGLLAVFLSSDRSEMLLWFRAEEPQLVKWGGSSHHGANDTRSPQHSYRRWEGVRHGFAKPWAEWEREMAQSLRHDVMEVMVRSLRRIAELNHRLHQAQISENVSQDKIGNAMRQTNEILEAKIQAQQSQQAVEAQFSFATQAGGLGVWKLQLGTRELTTSGMCKNNFGRDQDMPFSYEDLIHAISPDHRERTRAAIDRSADTGANYEVELPIVRPNGATGWVQMQAQVTYAVDSPIASLVGISLDITQRVLTQERIRQSQRIEAIGRLTAGVAHDFNNVLQALLGGIELAIDEVADRPEVCEVLELALQAGQRGARLTSHLLSFSHQQMLRSEPVDLSLLLKNLSITLTRILGHEIAVHVEMAPGMTNVLADAAHLDAALLNLALNARDAMPRGGELNISARAENGNIVIGVSDTGEGMTPDVLAQACEPFFSTKGLKGSGLGLSMVQGFARQSGGELNIQSILGQGTRIEITLPKASLVNPFRLMDKTVPEKGEGRILIVDDDPDVCRITATFLRKAGFEVVAVITGADALYELGAGLPFDVLVTDYAMPGMNGVDLVLRARHHYPSLPALIITGYAGAEALEDLPFNTTILRKPFRREDLTRRVKDLIEHDIVPVKMN